MNEPKGLTHVKIFSESATKKCIIDIHLTKRPPLKDGNGKNNFNGLWLDNWAEGFGVIKTQLLVKAFSNQLGFVVRYRTI